jgi:hypothetical protein
MACVRASLSSEEMPSDAFKPHRYYSFDLCFSFWFQEMEMLRPEMFKRRVHPSAQISNLPRVFRK